MSIRSVAIRGALCSPFSPCRAASVAVKVAARVLRHHMNHHFGHSKVVSPVRRSKTREHAPLYAAGCALYRPNSKDSTSAAMANHCQKVKRLRMFTLPPSARSRAAPYPQPQPQRTSRASTYRRACMRSAARRAVHCRHARRVHRLLAPSCGALPVFRLSCAILLPVAGPVVTPE